MLNGRLSIEGFEPQKAQKRSTKVCLVFCFSFVSFVEDILNDIIGKVIGDTICESYQIIADLVVVFGANQKATAYTKDSLIMKSPVLYSVDQQAVVSVMMPSNQEVIVLETEKGITLRDYNNRIVDESGNWIDYYLEPHTGAFFRKDALGNWFDIEGYKLESPVFLQDDVLVSLPGKASRKSLAFRDNLLLVSPNHQLIQVGKLVYNIHLKTVYYYGERITGLGVVNIVFPNQEAIQEVKIGLTQSAFIYEFSHQPFLIKDQTVDAFVDTFHRGSHRFEIFKVGSQKLAVDYQDGSLLQCDQRDVSIDFRTYVQIGKLELVRCRPERKSFFMDLNAKTAFYLAEFSGDAVVSIERSVLNCDGLRLRNMETINQRFVFNESDNKLFTLNDGEVIPERVEEVARYEDLYGLAIFGKEEKLFYKKSRRLIQLQNGEYEVEKILSAPGNRLLNAKSTAKENIVLDARQGYHNLTLGLSANRRIEKITGEPLTFSDTKVLQNVYLKTLGGQEKRVIDWNDKQLSVFTLPSDLVAYPGDKIPSSFQDNPVMELEFKDPIRLDERVFYKAMFINFDGKPVPTLIQRITARPLHLEGATHRNELVTSFVQDTLKNKYMLGPYRLMGVNTLDEEQESNQILFSLKAQKSWIPFEDHFFPILKRVVVHNHEAEWDYRLYECRTEKNALPEYIVVEKKEPYRVLVTKVKGKEVVKVFKNIDDVLEAPKKMSRLQKLFLSDPGYLKVIR